MLIRGIIIALHVSSIWANLNTTLNDLKLKRGIYQLGDGSDYSAYSNPQIGRLPQTRAYTDVSQIDLTYKPHEEPYQHSYEAHNPLKVPQNANFKVNEQTYSAQHHIPTYASNYPAFTANHQGLINPYTIPLHPKIASQIQNAVTGRPEINSDPYNVVPIIYGQPTGALPSLKYVNPYLKSQIQSTLPPYAQPLQQLKPPVVKFTTPNSQTRSFNPQLYKSQYYQPQFFDNPIVPQLQHYLPQIQSPFDVFTKSVTSAPIVVKSTPKPEQRKNTQSEDDDDEDEEDDDDDDRKEIRGKGTKHDVDDEEEFERGYEEAARDFPSHDDDDDDEPPRRYRHRDDYDPKYLKYKSRYVDDDDDYRRRPYEYDDDRRGRYSSRDPEGHYSNKHTKKESKKPKTDSRKQKTEEHIKISKKYHNKPAPKKIYYSSKKESIRNPKEAASTMTEVEFKPKYHSGFEPMKTSYVEKMKKHERDSESDSSSPVSSKKVYKENWFISSKVSKS